MTESRIELLVLDAHGIVLNAYWPSFLGELARRTGQPRDNVRHRWQTTTRADTWLGRIDDREVWQRLAGASQTVDDWRDILEAGYTRGLAAPCLSRWSQRVPIWLLSNHRTPWLLPRLARFDLLECFNCILVSDALGAIKPDPAAFRELLEHGCDPNRVLFVDDQLANVESARCLGLTALHAQESLGWLPVIDRLLDLETAAAGV